jgi:hypothetical protein
MLNVPPPAARAELPKTSCRIVPEPAGDLAAHVQLPDDSASEQEDSIGRVGGDSANAGTDHRPGDRSCIRIGDRLQERVSRQGPE